MEFSAEAPPSSWLQRLYSHFDLEPLPLSASCLLCRDSEAPGLNFPWADEGRLNPGGAHRELIEPSRQRWWILSGWHVPLQKPGCLTHPRISCNYQPERMMHGKRLQRNPSWLFYRIRVPE